MPFRFAFSDRTQIEAFRSSREALDAIYFYSPLWHIGIRGSGITVAVLDTGINPEIFPDATVVDSIDFTGENNTRDWKAPNDQHGSRVAACIRMIASDVKLTNLKVVPHQRHLTRDPVCRAIEHCINVFPAYQILNISLAFAPTRGEDSNPCRLCRLVEHAVERGMVVVTASPNTALVTIPPIQPPVSPCPARCDVAVAVPGGHTLDFAAYWNSLTRWRRWLMQISGRFGRTVGYSFTAGYTSGCAALLLSAFPEATPLDVRLALLSGSARCETALTLLLSDVAFAEAKARILAETGPKITDSVPSSAFVHDLGLALSFIEYRLLKSFQTQRGVDEFRTLQRILANQVPPALRTRFSHVEHEIEKYQVSPRIPEVAEILNETFNVRRFSRTEEALLAREHDIYYNPHNLEAWYQKGFLLSKLDRNQDATLAFETAAHIEPLDANSWYFRAKALDHLGNREEAIRAAEELTIRWPDTPRVWFAQAIFFSDIGYSERALSSYEKAISLQPDFIDAWKGKANVLRRLGHTADADAADDIASYRYPPGFHAFDFSATPNLVTAFGAWLSRDYRAIAKWAGRPWAPALYDSMLPEALVLWGLSVKMQGDVEGVPGLRRWAAGMWQAALLQNHGLSAISDLLIELSHQEGDIVEAGTRAAVDADLARRIELDGLLRRLSIQVDNGDFAAAQTTLGCAPQLLPREWMLAFAKSRLLIEQGMAAESLQLAEVASDLTPHVYAVRLNRARLLALLERWSEATAEYEHIIQAWPQSIAVRCELGHIYWQLGQTDAAYGHWEAAIQLKPEAVEPRLALFRARAAAGDTDRALVELRSVLALRPSEWRTYIAAAEFYYSLGRLEDCEREIKHALWRGKEWALGDGQPDRWGRDDLRSLGLLTRVLARQARSDELAHTLQLIGNIDTGYAEMLARELSQRQQQL